MSDKRKFQRVDFRKPVQYRVLDGQDPGILPALFYAGTVSCDLSEGGIRFRCEGFIPLQAVVAVVLDLDKEILCEVEGRVAWIQKVPHAESYLLGLEFLDSTENKVAVRRLHQYVEKILLRSKAKNNG